MVAFRLGRVPVRLHPTFVWFVAAWLAWTLSHGGPAEAVSQGLWIVVLFASVLWHEVGHMLAARAFGIETRAIDLLPFGGAAQLLMGRVEPFTDLIISAAGPLSSLALGAVGGALWWLTGWELALTVGIVNVLLGLFNLIPAFPMDGGRILRAVLAEAVGERRGSVVTLVIGFAFAVLFAAVGVLVPEPGLLLLALFMGFMQWQERRARQVRPAYLAT